jgi:hypothetical protein
MSFVFSYYDDKCCTTFLQTLPDLRDSYVSEVGVPVGIEYTYG